MGQIRSWLDEEITRHNPDVSFPDLPIQVEYRLDSSGTTSALTRHLSQISQDWKEGPGIGKTVILPVGAGMPKNRGVARGLKQVPGSIGYLSYAFAKQEKLSMAILENRAGQFVAPDLDSIQIGLHGSGVSISEVRDFVTDPKGDGAYPIVTYSWLLCYHVYDDPAKLAMLQELISYGLQDGQQYSGELGYVALLEEVSRSALTVSKSITLPQNADTATSIPVSEIEHLPPDTSGAVIDEVVEEETDVMPTGTETSREASADVQSDGVVVEEAVTEAKATNAAGIEKQQGERGEDGNDQTSAPTDQPPPAP